MRRALMGAMAACALLAAPAAHGQDAAATVAKAREQITDGSFADGLRTLGALKGKTLPPQLAIEASLLETTAVLVTQGDDAAANACTKAVVAASYDPEIARDRSPKVRDACKAAAKRVRGERLKGDKASIGKLDVSPPEVGYQPLRIATTVDNRPAYLRVVARVESSSIEGTFDVPLVPSDYSALLGTLDPAWIRPQSKLSIRLVAQDKFGDLGDPIDTITIDVPPAEAAVALGEVPKGAKVTLDGKPAKVDDKGRVAASAGKHEIAMTLESGAYAETTIELSRGVVARVALAPSEQSPSRVLPWIATGTSFALLVAGGVLLINAETRRQELEDAAAEREPGTDLPANDYATLAEIDKERKTFQYVGIGLLSGGGAVAVAALVFWLVPIGGSGGSEVSVTPIVTPTYLGMSGRF